MDHKRASSESKQDLDGPGTRTVDPEKPMIGDLVVDASDMRSFLIDLPPGGRIGMRSRQTGYDEAFAEIVANQAEIGPRAGVTEWDFATLTGTEGQIAQIDARLPAARKLVELLEETRAKLDDQNQRLVNAIAVSVEGRANAMDDPELLGRYEKTRTYRSAVGLRAARTRRRNALAEDGVELEAPVDDVPAGESADIDPGAELSTPSIG